MKSSAALNRTTDTGRHGPRHFFIVGAQRCGTTYLCRLLDDHPEIEMAKPLRPEPKFFLSNDSVERGLTHYESMFFGNKPNAWVRGEKSTSYMESSAVAKRIAAWFPTAEIIFVLRDPIDRAVSHYWFSVQNGLEKLSLSEAFLREDERRDDYDRARVSASPYAYLSRGRYIDCLLTYEKHFPRERVRVLLYEQLVASPDVVRGLYEALGVDPDFTPPSVGQRVNEGERRTSSLPLDLQDHVTNYFARSTAELGKHLNLDLARWWSSARQETGTRRLADHAV